MPRETLPERRPCWTAEAKIDGHRFFLTVGERLDGRLGEIFLVAAKQGTFTRGILDAFARMTSLAIQMGASVEEVAGVMSGMNFLPNGMVSGSPVTGVCSSVADWVAQELMASYADFPVPRQGSPKEFGAVSRGSGV